LEIGGGNMTKESVKWNVNDLFIFNEEWEEQVCEVDGCESLGQHLGRYHANGEIKRRKKCPKHHRSEYGMLNWDYKKYRKTYCENIDGRLGFVCSSVIVESAWEWQLDADHINGDHDDNREENIQTLCKCCHPIKTKQQREVA
jgi:hypothetical protein